MRETLTLEDTYAQERKDSIREKGFRRTYGTANRLRKKKQMQVFFLNTCLNLILKIKCGRFHFLFSILAPRRRVDSIQSNEELEVTVDVSNRSHLGSFVFPPPPAPPTHYICRRPVSASPYFHNASDSDSQSESGRGIREHSSPISIHHPSTAFRGYQSDGSPVGLQPLSHLLPAIGVFWDIENCQVS